MPQTKIPYEVMKKLPKAELHCHLDGGVRVKTIIELAKEQGVELPSFDEAELKKRVSVDENCQSLVEYLEGFDITNKVLQKPYALTRAMYELCEDAYNDGVRYLEVRFSPILHTGEGLSQGAVMEAVCEGREMALARFPMNIGILVCAMRQMPSEVTAGIAEVAWRYRTKGVVGFDLAGPEKGFSSKLHKKAFDIVRKRCVNCTLHSGEAAGWESVNDSIQYCGATRVGHGVAIQENPELEKYCVDKGIGVECCITSNIHTKAIQKITDHPIRRFFDKGMLCVPCTDNMTVSDVLLTHEYMLIQDKFNFTVPEIVRLIDNGFKVGFLPPIVKKRIRADAFNTTLRILKENDIDVSGVVADPYFTEIGVDYAELGIVAPENIIVPKILKRKEPEITAEIVKALPKTDLHCRFDGSVPPKFIWEELNAAKVDLEPYLHKKVESFEEFEKIITSLESSNDDDIRIAKEITNLVLQTKEQLEKTCEILIDRAIEDNVRYIELVLRPTCHTHKTIKTPEEVVDIIQNKCISLVEKHKHCINVGIVINASNVVDDPLSLDALAKLTIAKKNEKGSLICGFGVHGNKPLSQETLPFFVKSFEQLKEHKVNVVFASGFTNGEDIITAIHSGGAARISGAFAVHSRPAVMQYLAQNRVPVEIGWTPRMKFHSDNVFSGNLIRILIENGVPVTPCTFRSNGDLASSRTESILAIANQCSMRFSDLVDFLATGFRYNFQHYDVRKEAEKKFWEDVAVVAKQHDFKSAIKAQFFPQ